MADQLETRVTVVGAGLAGSECALQLARLGMSVTLVEMRGTQLTPAHKTPYFAELVCSNSFGTENEISAPGQLKWEAEQMGSEILEAARSFRVPAGQALSMDRDRFSQSITEKIENHPLIQVERRKVSSLADLPRPLVISTGPLTDPELAQDIGTHLGKGFLYFFDAIAPIIDADTIDTSIAWKADRYDKGSPDYWNCPLDKEQYYALIEAIKNARKIEPKEFERTPYFEGCMPIEAMIERGDRTLSFGPMKPKGLRNPRTGREPYAVVQLRQENMEATAYNMVGFQTKMAYPEQVRIFRTIPGLEKAEFLKLGSMHRNLFIDTPKTLNPDLSSPHDPLLFFAGQITGVEGYFESTCIGLLVARFLSQKVCGQKPNLPPRATALGSLLHAITMEKRGPKDVFQPTNINFGLFPNLEAKSKEEKKRMQIERAREALRNWRESDAAPDMDLLGNSDRLGNSTLVGSAP